MIGFWVPRLGVRYGTQHTCCSYGKIEHVCLATTKGVNRSLRYQVKLVCVLPTLLLDTKCLRSDAYRGLEEAGLYMYISVTYIYIYIYIYTYIYIYIYVSVLLFVVLCILLALDSMGQLTTMMEEPEL